MLPFNIVTTPKIAITENKFFEIIIDELAKMPIKHEFYENACSILMKHFLCHCVHAIVCGFMSNK